MDGKVYLITNNRNSKVYVGITRRTPDYRMSMHVRAAEAGKGSAASLQQAIRDFGASAFAIQLLATAKTVKKLASLEVHYIGIHGSLAPNGYNLNRGGAFQEGPQLRIVEGEEYWSLAELADAYDILPVTLHKRMQSGRWTIEQAVGIAPPPNRERGGKEVTIGGTLFPSLLAACKHFSVDKRIVDMRINRMGWSLDEAFGVISRNTNAIVVAGEEFASRLEACRAYDLNDKMVDSRLRGGWTIDQAFNLSAPPFFERKQPSRKPRYSVEYEGKLYRSSAELAKAFNINAFTLAYRLRQGWSLDAALGKEAAPERNERVSSFEIDGKKYVGAVELSAAYGVSVSSFRFRQKAGWTLRQALNLDPPPSKANVHYLVTRPTGETIYVEDWTAFAVREGLPRNGSALRVVAYRDKSHSWKGWGCRKVDRASEDTETGPPD
ncbi:GIY-YIG nuclease family protein [Bradyrhizobium sp. CCBAU 51745]|uniref:GIY-YIG nuclease family protein n=1 Tax=Bradyrhizobium sp. CCBAU 51745 TaxID=1325099 RepID=UPI0023065039|nr:GIY-YIG nuclease family protein [Bradyrhizobium sp. CCBAU 51745]